MYYCVLPDVCLKPHHPSLPDSSSFSAASAASSSARAWALPELWRWSSFRSYFLGEAGLVRVNEWEALKMKIRLPSA